jgi:predicted ArsR family transcriptional regulator
MSTTIRTRRSKVTKEKDALGSREGTQAAKINACLRKRAKAFVDEIAKESGQSSSRVRDHLKYLVKKGAGMELYILGNRT